MNPFEAYADEKGYRGLPKRHEKLARGPSELDRMEAEKQRLSKAYRKWKREQAKALYAQEPRLKSFRRYLRGITDGDEMLSDISASWLPAAPVDVRIFALRMVDARCQRIRLMMGETALDDPLPPETSVYFKARDILYPGARG
jgi:hypothetical protein